MPPNPRAINKTSKLFPKCLTCSFLLNKVNLSNVCIMLKKKSMHNIPIIKGEKIVSWSRLSTIYKKVPIIAENAAI